MILFFLALALVLGLVSLFGLVALYFNLSELKKKLRNMEIQAELTKNQTDE